MAVMPLVPETKMVDVGKLISLGNLLVRKVCNSDFVRRFWSQLHDKNCLYILSFFHFKSQRQLTLLHYNFQRQLTLSILTSRDNTLFPFWLPETTHSFHFDFQRQLTLSILTSRDNSLFPFWLPETTHSFHFDFQRQHTLSLLHLISSSQPHKNVYILQPFSFLFYKGRLAPASKTTTEISSTHRKKQTTNMGEDTFLLTYIIKIL